MPVSQRDLDRIAAATTGVPESVEIATTQACFIHSHNRNKSCTKPAYRAFSVAEARRVDLFLWCQLEAQPPQRIAPGRPCDDNLLCVLVRACMAVDIR